MSFREPFRFTTEESSEYITILSDLDTYAYQATLQFYYRRTFD